MNKFLTILFFFFFATQVVEAGCPAKWEMRGGQQVRVVNPECAATLGRTGDGDYNSRRGFGIFIGGILGGGVAHALGGDPSAIVGGLIGGAQTGAYIGSTYDEDAKLRDVVELNRSRCGTGTYYNTVSKQCEVDTATLTSTQAATPTQAEQSSAEGRSFQTVAEADAYCATLAVGGTFDSERGACVAPSQEQRTSSPSQLDCAAEASKKPGGINHFVQHCAKFGRNFGQVTTKEGRPGCGCQPLI